MAEDIVAPMFVSMKRNFLQFSGSTINFVNVQVLIRLKISSVTELKCKRKATSLSTMPNYGKLSVKLLLFNVVCVRWSCVLSCRLSQKHGIL